MFSFLHSFQPQPILFSFGPFTVHWYGLCVVVGILAALIVTLHLAKRHGLPAEKVFDLSFWLIIGGLAGARLYDVLLNLGYYSQHPWQVLAVWQGGLAIHGGLIAGLIIVWLFAKRQKISFWKLSALVVPGLALAQSIGRWGNYFNQEIFGRPTSLPWGIPIDLLARPIEYLNDNYFHPVFLYESLGCFLIFLILIAAWSYLKKPESPTSFYAWLTALYVVLYSILRFALEFIRIDQTPYWLDLRLPQIISLLAIIAATLIIIFISHDQRKTDT